MGTRDDWGLAPGADETGPPVFELDSFDDDDDDDDEPRGARGTGGTGADDGAASAGDLTLREDEIPEFVFVPSEYPTGGVTEDTRIQLRRVEGGGVALLAYSSLDLLVANLGEHQPWVAFPGHKVQELLAETGANAAVLDAPLDPARLEETEDE